MNIIGGCVSEVSSELELPVFAIAECKFDVIQGNGYGSKAAGGECYVMNISILDLMIEAFQD